MIKMVTPILVALGLGFSFVCLLWPAQRRLRRDLPMLIFLSVGVGFGISSLLFFLWLAAFGHVGSAFAGCEIGLLLALSALAVRVRRRKEPAVPAEPSASRPKSKFEWIATAAFLVSLLAASNGFLWFVRRGLNGGWDAWISGGSINPPLQFSSG